MRVCFQLQVKPDRLAEYKERHAHVWPDMLAAFTGKALVDGTIEGAEGDTYEAGKLGEFTVDADGVVLLGEPTVFNADNIDDFDF